MRPASVLVTAVLSLLLRSTPAGAITNGVPDTEDRHPNVGFMAVKYRGYDPIFLWCSGTLIAPNVFLTASHCSIGLEYGLAAGFIEAGYVSFDRAYSYRLADLHLAFEVERAVTNPDYTFTHRSDDGDVAVLILKEDVTLRAPGIRPARLPEAGLLDDLSARGGLHDVKFPAVGYGDRLVDRGDGQPTTYGFGERYIGVQEYRGLGPGYLHVSQNPSTDDGGTCYGDSGGPNFLGDSDIIAALTVYGDTWCRATSRAYRLDTESVRHFLRDYVTLP
jgi:hypothetical protein